MAQIGYVGLGVMGGGVARRLLEAGHDVTGHNRTRSKADALIARLCAAPLDWPTPPSNHTWSSRVRRIIEMTATDASPPMSFEASGW